MTIKLYAKCDGYTERGSSIVQRVEKAGIQGGLPGEGDPCVAS